MAHSLSGNRIQLVSHYHLKKAARSGNIDAYFGKILTVAAFPKNEALGCKWYTAKLVVVKCACEDDIETAHAKLVSYKYVPDNGTEVFIVVSVVNTAAEVVNALTKYVTCICGGNTYQYAVYRPIKDKFYAQYMKYLDKSNRISAILLAKSAVTKAEIEATIQSVYDLKTKDYGILCE